MTREFTNGSGQTVLLQLYSPSGGFTYRHRQLLGKLFGESYPKGYWVSKESFDSAMKRRRIHPGKLKSNAWTLSALVNPTTLRDNDIRKYFSPEQEDDILANLEAELVENLAKEKTRIIDAIRAEPDADNTEFHFVKVDLTDPQGHDYIPALGYFATNSPHLKFHHSESQQQQGTPVASEERANISIHTRSTSALPFYMPMYEGQNEYLP
jgi:hypothetical protein